MGAKILHDNASRSTDCASSEAMQLNQSAVKAESQWVERIGCKS